MSATLKSHFDDRYLQNCPILGSLCARLTKLAESFGWLTKNKILGDIWPGRKIFAVSSNPSEATKYKFNPRFCIVEAFQKVLTGTRVANSLVYYLQFPISQVVSAEKPTRLKNIRKLLELDCSREVF